MKLEQVSSAAFWAALASPALVPFLAPHLPFQDWPAHAAVIGMLDLADDPAAKIDTYYGFRGWLGPNRLFYFLGMLAAKVLSPLGAANLILAIGLGALGPSMAVLATAAGVDRRVALFSLPLALGRHVYCGFSSNAAALPALALALAGYFVARSRPSLAVAGWIVGALWLALGMHAFVYLVALGLLVLMAAIDLLRPPRLGPGVGLGAGLLSLVLFPWCGRVVDPPSGGPGVVDAVWSATASADRSGLFGALWEWLFASYRYATLDDVAQGIWVGIVVVLLLATLYAERGRHARSPRPLLLATIGATLVMFVVLPSSIGPPVNWWGGNLRLPAIAALLAIPAAGPCFPGKRSWLIGAGAAVSIAIAGGMLIDLIAFDRREMGGFEEVLAEIPPGRKTSALHYTPREVHEYPGEPHGYVSNYYLAAKGGLVPQNLFENAGEPFFRKVGVNAPPWGYGSMFHWPHHGAGFEAFLVRINDAQPDAPFDGDKASLVTLVKSAGRWRYYEPKAN